MLYRMFGTDFNLPSLDVEKITAQVVNISNILWEDFDCEVQWEDYLIKKWETKGYVWNIALCIADAMIMKYFQAIPVQKQKVQELFNQIFWAKVVDYSNVWLEEIVKKAEEKWIEVEKEWKKKTKKELVQELHAKI